MASAGEVVEHGSSRTGRWLKIHRLRTTLWIALAEALLVVIHVISWWLVVLLAAIAVAFYWFVGRESRSDTVRHASWIAAASQLLVVFVPIILAIATSFAIAAVVIIAVVALVILFTERR